MKLGELLRSQHIISDTQLEHALELQQQEDSQKKLGEILLKLGYVTEEKILSIVALQRGFPMLRLGYPLAPEIVSLVPRELCVAHCLIPIDRFGKHLLVAMADPLNRVARKQLEALHSGDIKYKYVLATKEDINKAIRLYYPRNTHVIQDAEEENIPSNALQAHIQRIAEAAQRFAELRKQFREETPLLHR